MKYFLLLLIPIFLGCNCTKRTTENGAVAENQFEILFESPYGGKDDRFFETIHSAEEFNKLISSPLFQNDEEFVKRFAAIDFEKEAVIVLNMGLKNTGGYAISVEEVVKKDNTTYVKVRETLPEPGSPVTMVLTNPFCIAIIKTNENIVFQ